MRLPGILNIFIELDQLWIFLADYEFTLGKPPDKKKVNINGQVGQGGEYGLVWSGLC